MRSGSRRARLAAAVVAAVIAVGAFSLAAAQALSGRHRAPASSGSGHSSGAQAAPRYAPKRTPIAGSTPPGSTPASASGQGPRGAPSPGTLGSYWVGQARFTYTEPAHTGPAGQLLGLRNLYLLVRYPAVSRPGRHRSEPARGRFPLIVFAPGFRQCAETYASLLQAWASAGYVVAGVNFPHSDCLTGAAATESDMVNQPGDMSYVITKLLSAAARRTGLLAGLIDPAEVAVAGQSDGGDTVAALVANSCCADRRIAAAAVLSGAEWAPMPGRYFAVRPPPILFVQGSADDINPPSVSLQLYQADPARARYYLDLFGIGHMTPYASPNPVERLTARVTLAFFDRWVLGQLSAAVRMRADGTVPGVAALVSAGQLPPGS